MKNKKLFSITRNGFMHLIGIWALWGSIGLLSLACENPSFPTEEEQPDEKEETEKPLPPDSTEETPEPDDETPETGDETGDADHETEDGIPILTITEAQDWCYSSTADELVWVVGYIVGYTSGSSIQNFQSALPTDVETNILLADAIDETDCAKCFPIRLEKGTAFRYELNLAEHPENIRRLIAVAGYVEEYFRVPGIREPLSYEWIEQTVDTPDDLPFPSLSDEETLIPGGRALTGTAKRATLKH